ncbi:hypothetical protein [Emticicia sp. BO119]|uniref:hypothetical protein n=1 Tax=Emticicia sp. BO119 TaxID=2757768 RepID=UPI0015F0A892|nr:hypothetical protein [Emticicia sp. BO119]MBA4850845.1 hypothetical protein [Emticicia sp. BO119]
MLRLTNNFSLRFPEFLKSENTSLQRAIFVHSGAFSLGSAKIHFLRKLTIVFFLVSAFSIGHSFAQRDQITTQAGEKIRCRILDETPTRFIYAYIAPNGKVLRNEIFKNLVTDFKYNFYEEDLVTKGNKIASKSVSSKEPSNASPKNTDNQKTTKEKTDTDKKTVPDNKVTDNKLNSQKETIENKEKEQPKSETTIPKSTPKKQEKKTVAKKEEKTETPLATKKAKSEYDDYLKFRIGVRGGFGNMLAKLNSEDEFGLYQEKLLRGWTWGADFAYFPKDNFGFGVMFNNFQSKNSAENINFRFIENGLPKDTSGSITNKRLAKFVGPVFYFRKNIDFKTMVILGLSPGAYFYNDKGTYNGVTIPYKGWDYGGAATLGIDFLLGNDITGRDIILSLEAGYNYGKIRSMNFNDGNGTVKLANPVDLSRVDFTVGLRFTRYPRYFRN